MADYAAESIVSSPLYASALDLAEGLVETMESRALINRAVGVIMAGEHHTAEEALDRLRELALASSEPMNVVARWVLEERPTDPSPSGAGAPSDPEGS